MLGRFAICSGTYEGGEERLKPLLLALLRNSSTAERRPAWGKREGRPLVYLFYKKPNAEQLDKLERTILEEVGDSTPLPTINYYI